MRKLRTTIFAAIIIMGIYLIVTANRNLDYLIGGTSIIVGLAFMFPAPWEK